MRDDRGQGCLLPALRCHRDQVLLDEDSSALIKSWLFPKFCRADLVPPQYSGMSPENEASGVECEVDFCERIRKCRTRKVGSKTRECLVNEAVSSGNSAYPAFDEERQSHSPITSATTSGGIDDGILVKVKFADTYDKISFEGSNSANGEIDSCFYDDEFAMEELISAKGIITSCCCDEEIAMEELIPAKEKITCCIADDGISLDKTKSASEKISSDHETTSEMPESASLIDGISRDSLIPTEKISYCYPDDEIAMSGISCDMPVKKKIKSCISDEVSTRGKFNSSYQSIGETAIDGISDAISVSEKFGPSSIVDHGMTVVTDGNSAEEASSSHSNGHASSEERNMETTASCWRSSAGGNSEALQDYLPGLDDEVAQRCLAFLSLADRRSLAGVSRRHRMLVESGLFFQLRHMYGVVESWVCIYTSGDGVWMAYNPVRNVWRILPPANINPVFECADRESLSAGAHLLWLGREVFNFACYRYDLSTNSWDVGPPMVNPRCLFASASCGNYAYVAGGFAVGPMLTSVLSSAEIYDSFSGSWTALPPMHTCRQKCSGAFMDGKFYVIGGKDANHNCLTSGEVYDPGTRSWTIIPDMYVQHTSQSFEPSPPLVAVAGNQLYAIECSTNLLKVYNKDENTWKVLGPVPLRTDICSGWGLAFKALGDELFVIGGYQDYSPSQEGVVVFSLKPKFYAEAPEWRPGAHPPEWKLLNLRIRGSGGFLYNCAIMVC